MKKLVLIALVGLAAGCGSQAGATSTVTSPPVTNTVTKTDQTQVKACQTAIALVLKATGQLLKATGLYEGQIKPAYIAGGSGTSVDAIVSKVRDGTVHVHQGTALMKKASSYAALCAK